MDIHICILAAGQSTRMKSKTSKMLHPLCGKPMIHHVHSIAAELQPKTLSIVVGHQRDQIMDLFAEKPVDFVVQEKQNGTAHAVLEYLKHHPNIQGIALVMSGDTPLLRADRLHRLIVAHRESNAAVTLLTTLLEMPIGYGRIVRNDAGLLEKIVEEADASAEQKAIREINAGIYVFDLARLREVLPQVQAANRQKEYYLPDVIQLSLQYGWTVAAVAAPPEEVVGINTRVELAAAERIMRQRINEQWMLRGVTLRDPQSIYIDVDVRIGTDTVIHPNVYLEGGTLIGSEVVIHPNCRITESYIDSECVIYENTSIDSAHLEAGVKVGPFARLRPETVLGKNVRIGNFVELKKSSVGEGTKANHLAYLGDAKIGKNVNIGAGTITCNYDGEKKHPTIIEDNVFIGSDTQLIAPVKVGKDAYVGAGSSITEDVPPGALAIARGRQVNKEGWVARKKSTAKNAKNAKK